MAYYRPISQNEGVGGIRIGQFGGALQFSEYGLLKRLMMKQITTELVTEQREPDGDIEFTDWDAVDAFAADVAAFVEGRLGVTPDTTEDSSV